MDHYIQLPRLFYKLHDCITYRTIFYISLHKMGFCPSINGMVLTLFYILCFKMRYGVKHQTKIALVTLALTIVYVCIRMYFVCVRIYI